MKTINEQPFDRKIAAVMSMMLPGLGQMLKGEIMPGIIWAITVGAGYFAFLYPGILLHLLCVIDAAYDKENKIKNLKTPRGISLLLVVIFLLIYIVLRSFNF